MTRAAGRWWGPWWGPVLAIAGIGIGAAAGFWQVDRAREKSLLVAGFNAGATSPALPRLVSNTDALQLRFRTLQISGRYDPEHQLLLDNLSYRGRPGYQVLTPFLSAGGVVLVNRGWVPASGDRSVLPDVGVGAAPRELHGRIEQLPRPGIRLGKIALPADAPWPRRLLFPTAAEIDAQLGTAGGVPGTLKLRDYQLLLDPAAGDGYVRDWQPPGFAGGMTPERHLAYAVQWFGLALTVFVFYVVLVFRNRKPSS